MSRQLDAPAGRRTRTAIRQQAKFRCCRTSQVPSIATCTRSHMNFQVYDLKQQRRRATTVVTLSIGANVRLMDLTHYDAYRLGRQHATTAVSPRSHRSVSPSRAQAFGTSPLTSLD